MTEPRRLLDDPDTSLPELQLLGSLAPPEPMSASAHAALGARLGESVAALTLMARIKIAASWAALIAAAGGAVVVVANGTEEPARLSAGLTAQLPPNTAFMSAVQGAELVPPLSPSGFEPAQSKASDTSGAAPVETTAATPVPTDEDPLAIEEALLEQARQAAATSPGRALALLQQHERRFPAGQLTVERLYLAAKVHHRSGNRAAAQRYADQLEQRFPRSGYAARVRALLASPER